MGRRKETVVRKLYKLPQKESNSFIDINVYSKHSTTVAKLIHKSVVYTPDTNLINAVIPNNTEHVSEEAMAKSGHHAQLQFKEMIKEKTSGVPASIVSNLLDSNIIVSVSNPNHAFTFTFGLMPLRNVWILFTS